MSDSALVTLSGVTPQPVAFSGAGARHFSVRRVSGSTTGTALIKVLQSGDSGYGGLDSSSNTVDLTDTDNPVYKATDIEVDGIQLTGASLTGDAVLLVRWW